MNASRRPGGAEGSAGSPPTRPRAARALVRCTRPNAPIKIYRGRGCLRQAGHEYEGDLTIALEWAQFPELRFRLDHCGPRPAREPYLGIPAPLVLTATGRQEDATVTHWVESGLDPEAPLVRITGIVHRARDPLNVLGPTFRAHVVNFRDFAGSPVWYGPRHSSLARLSFMGERAHVTVDRLPNVKEMQDSLDDVGGFGITGVLEVENFTEEPNDALLTRLHLLLSFFSGRWVSIVLPFRQQIVREKTGVIPWSSWVGQPWARSHSWLPPIVRDDFGGVLDAFLKLVDGDAQDEILARALRWYLEANTNSQLASAIVVGHAALELLSYFILVTQERVLSRKNFGDAVGASVFADLLQWLGVSGDCPSGLVALGDAMDTYGWTTPVVAIANVRNCLIHPERRGKDLSHRAQYEMLHLTQWYTELAVLKLLGYQGSYRHRIPVISRRSISSFGEPVPWASPPTSELTAAT